MLEKHICNVIVGDSKLVQLTLKSFLRRCLCLGANFKSQVVTSFFKCYDLLSKVG